MEQTQVSQMHGPLLQTLKKQNVLSIDEGSLVPIKEGRFRSLFTINTNKGTANVQVRFHAASFQVALDVISSNLHLSLTP